LLNRERKLRRQLAETMISETPPLTGTQLLQCRSIISGVETDLRQYENALAAALPLRASGNGERPVRVLLTGVPVVFGAERVVELIEQCGATVVCLENCTGVKPILEDVDETEKDPLRALARKYYHLPCSVMTPNNRRFTSLAELAKVYRPDCVLDLVWHACLTYDLESARVREWAEQSCNLPFLKITTDYSPADSGRIRARLEALFEMVRDRKAPPSRNRSEAMKVV
jgi:benzoyl-CoA reductase/2-hydroxyglutaryl-CoA dehydratase subunit BcrC/BadD/HgdB